MYPNVPEMSPFSITPTRKYSNFEEKIISVQFLRTNVLVTQSRKLWPFIQGDHEYLGSFFTTRDQPSLDDLGQRDTISKCFLAVESYQSEVTIPRRCENAMFEVFHIFKEYGYP